MRFSIAKLFIVLFCSSLILFPYYKLHAGFNGTSTIIGLEYAAISKNISMGISFKRYGIEFDQTVLFGIPFEHKSSASDYILELKSV